MAEHDPYDTLGQEIIPEYPEMEPGTPSAAPVLSSGETAILEEIYRCFPDAREVVDAGGDARTRKPGREELPASTTPQATLFEEDA